MGRALSLSAAALAGAAVVMLLGAAGREPEALPARAALSDSVAELRLELSGREGELQLARLELERLQRIVDASAEHGITADLAALIHDVSTVEGVDPGLAYSLIRVESGFNVHARSPAGAMGLTQVMPATARWLDPDAADAALLEPRTNLHLGLRYLRMMMEQYDGDLRLALLAYNRGPGTVDSILLHAGDPGNGYAAAVAGPRLPPR